MPLWENRPKIIFKWIIEILKYNRNIFPLKWNIKSAFFVKILNSFYFKCFFQHKRCNFSNSKHFSGLKCLNKLFHLFGWVWNPILTVWFIKIRTELCYKFVGTWFRTNNIFHYSAHIWGCGVDLPIFIIFSASFWIKRISSCSLPKCWRTGYSFYAVMYARWDFWKPWRENRFPDIFTWWDSFHWLVRFIDILSNPQSIKCYVIKIITL